MSGDRVGRYLYGYRYSELNPEDLKIDKENIKKDLKIKGCKITELDDMVRTPMTRTLPIYFNYAQPTPDQNHQATIVTGLLKRTGTKPPTGSSIVQAAVKYFTRSFCEQHFKRLELGDVDYTEWIANTPYSKARKDQLTATWLNHENQDPRVVPKGDQVESFIKFEFYPEFKAPRVINARSDYFKNYSGPLFDAIGKQVFELPFFIKTVAVVERPDDIMQGIWDLVSKILNCDASAYESHFIDEILESLEFELYDYMTESVPEYAQKMSVIKEVLKGDQKLCFKNIIAQIHATRMSGEMNTSLGNGFSTLILNLFFAWLRNVEVKLRAEGDDNLSAWQVEDLAPTAEDWKELGWIMKVEEPKDACRASFCGNVFTPNDRIVVTDPRATLAKFGWVDKKYIQASEQLLMQLLRAKGLSLVHQYNGCPILSRLGRKIVELTNHIRIRKSVVNNMELYKRELFNQYLSTPMPDEIIPPGDTRLLVEELYNISVEDQLAIEAALEHLSLYTCVELHFIAPPIWSRTFDQYTCPIGETWYSPFEDRERLRAFILSFGGTTRGFTNDYYRL